MHTEGHDMGKDTVGNAPAHSETPKIDAEHPGYEIQDVNVSGVAVFLAGLFGTVIIFFFFCYGMGKVINNLWEKEDGPATKWTIAAGAVPAGKGGNLASNPEIEQKQLGEVVNTFPSPRLDIDDGNQATADLHAREDLLLNYYSKVDGQPDAVRIPIDRAMELIAQRGLPVEAQTTSATTSVAYANKPEVKAPLTTGFARTGFELTVIEAREQKMNFNRAENESGK
jgi:Na+-transporting methylmalonyl-CoA/oxaloacetate decarboxylase gamma subunit